MKLRLTTLIGSLAFLVGCQSGTEYQAPNQKTAANNSAVISDSDDATSASRSDASEEIEEKAAAPVAAVEAPAAPAAPVPLTNADLLAMDAVIITAVLNGNAATYFSDVGNTSVTNAQAVANAGQAPTGSQLAANAAIQVKVGQNLNFCNHASSTGALRVHAANGSAFSHWPNSAQLQPGQCSTGAGFPEAVLASAAGNTPGNNLYNHNGTENTSRIFVQVIQ